jgi:hypothetical protein
VQYDEYNDLFLILFNENIHETYYSLMCPDKMYNNMIFMLNVSEHHLVQNILIISYLITSKRNPLTLYKYVNFYS